MKKFKLSVLLVLLGLIISLRAQQSGLILNTDDFLNGRIFTADSRAKLHLHLLRTNGQIEIEHNDSLYRFSKSEIYGYCDVEGKSYRFFHDRVYAILNPGEKILIYSLSSGTGFKNSPLTATYFFSKEAGSEIYSLTLSHLLQVFSDNSAFTLVLELYCKSDTDLFVYDSFYHMYKLNHLLELSKHLKIEP